MRPPPINIEALWGVCVHGEAVKDDGVEAASASAAVNHTLSGKATRERHARIHAHIYTHTQTYTHRHTSRKAPRRRRSTGRFAFDAVCLLRDG